MKLVIPIVSVLVLGFLTFVYFNGDDLVIAGWHTIIYPPYYIVATVSLVLLWLIAVLYFFRVLKNK